MNPERSNGSHSSASAQPSANGPLHSLLANGFEEKPLWTGLYESARDAFFPPRLPPLQLTSTPVPTPDRMATRTNPWAVGTAALANAGLLALLLLFGLTSTLHRNPSIGSKVHLKDFTLFAPASSDPSHGGGSGGDHSLTDPIAGRSPRPDIAPIAPPQVPVLQNPRLAVNPSIAVSIKLPDNSLPNIGVQSSHRVMLASNGPGSGAGIGTHCCGGDGPGNGPGYGPGDKGGFGGDVYKPGTGGVTSPIPIVSPDAEFSDEARRNKYQGVCMIAIVVDAQGYPRNPRVVRSLGMGLDEKALEAVARYRFKPALKNGKPVAAAILVEVNFRLY